MDPGDLRRLRHDLRTPVNHLLGFTELLLEDATDDGGVWGAQLRKISDAGRDLLPPIDTLIDAVREGEDPSRAVDLIRPLLAGIGDACDLLDAEAARLGDEDVAADLAVIRNAAVHLLDLVSGPVTMSPGDTSEPREPAAEDSQEGTVEYPGMVLVVDDDAQNREMLSRRLARLGHVAEVASGGHEALAMLHDRPFDVLLLDVMMPEMDGFEVLAHLRGDAALRELPVIMLSALDELAAAVRCIELGADDYLTKPVDSVLLRARIGACLEHKRLRDTEVAYLRQAAQVTGPAIIAQILLEDAPDLKPDEDEASLRAAISREAEMIDLPKGETLFSSGDPGDCMYVVLSGRLRIDELDERGQLRLCGEALRGGTIGELEMLTGQPRPTTIGAVRDARLARIPREGFERIATTHPRLLTRTTRDVIDRLRDAFQRRPVAQASTTFVLLTVSNGVPIDRLSDRLHGALSVRGDTLLLNRGRLPSVLGHDASIQLTEDGNTVRPAAWLNEIELRYNYVIYQADLEPSVWTRRCLRQADHVLLVGRGEPTADVHGLAHEIAHNAQGATVDLLLVHEEGASRPTGTGAWLNRWDVRMHHHLRLDDEAGLEHLVRRLTGTSIDLVLGGGGARGWAHVGVIRAIEEAGIPVDAIGGTSMGALIGGLAAHGTTWEQILEHARVWSSPRHLFDYTLPVISFITGGKMTAMLQAVYGDACIEDLWRGFFCISSSLTSAHPVIHRQGPLWKAVRASISMPGFLPPVHQERELLVDGGYLNDLPIDVMRDLHGSGEIVAVNVSQAVEMPGETDLGPSLSGWNVLWRKLVPWVPQVPAPGLAATIMRAASLSGVHNLDASVQLADLVISPPVGQFGTLDFAAYQQIVDAGYEGASRQIEQWQRTRKQAAFPGVP